MFGSLDNMANFPLLMLNAQHAASTHPAKTQTITTTTIINDIWVLETQSLSAQTSDMCSSFNQNFEFVIKMLTKGNQSNGVTDWQNVTSSRWFNYIAHWPFQNIQFRRILFIR